MQNGIHINSTDYKLSTATHWAAFAGAELTMSYILAWGDDIEATDSKG